MKKTLLMEFEIVSTWKTSGFPSSVIK
jgi:hypothetical protein